MIMKDEKVIPVLMHGDAAFAGQGIVAECFAMSGYLDTISAEQFIS